MQGEMKAAQEIKRRRGELEAIVEEKRSELTSELSIEDSKISEEIVVVEATPKK